VSSSGSPVPANELGSRRCARAGQTLQLERSSLLESPSHPPPESSSLPALVESPSHPSLESSLAGSGSGALVLLQPSSWLSSYDSLPQPELSS
jgi:hypothetical protein